MYDWDDGDLEVGAAGRVFTCLWMAVTALAIAGIGWQSYQSPARFADLPLCNDTTAKAMAGPHDPCRATLPSQIYRNVNGAM